MKSKKLNEMVNSGKVIGDYQEYIKRIEFTNRMLREQNKRLKIRNEELERIFKQVRIMVMETNDYIKKSGVKQ